MDPTCAVDGSGRVWVAGLGRPGVWLLFWQAPPMDLNHYVFRSVWPVPVSKADVLEVLGDLGGYPAWWPEVRRAVQLGETSFELSCRSYLPYDLVFRSTQSRRDYVAGVLEARLTGDLEGFSRWTVTSDGVTATAVFEEDVVAKKALLRRLALVARPAFRANHSLMMSHGRAGRRAYVAGYAAAPWHGAHRGHDGVAASFTAFGSAREVERFRYSTRSTLGSKSRS